MPYRYLEDVATADVAFEAWGDTTEAMFKAAAEATMNVMVEDLDAITPRQKKIFSVEERTIDLLLVQFLQKFIFYKDAEGLLLRVRDLRIEKREGTLSCAAETCGERIDPETHALCVDIKAVTFHRLEVKRTGRGWEATVVLDI